MKTEITNNGWKEITIKEFKIISKRWESSSFKNITTSEWIASSDRLGLKNRKNCNCCHKPWRGMSGKVNFFTTDKGNKAICDQCMKKIKESKK